MLPGDPGTNQHVITPLFWLSLGVMAGILIGDALGGATQAWLVGTGAACLAALAGALYARRWTIPAARPAQVAFNHPPLPSIVLVPMMLAAVCLGAARDRAVTQPLDPSYIGWYAGQDLTAIVEGVLVRPPDERDRYANLLVQVEGVQAGELAVPQPVSGLLQVSVSPGDWQYGDRLRLEGEITLPEGESASYRQYLLRHGISATMPFPKAQLLEHGEGNPLLAAIYGLRERALHTVYRLFPDPEASLLAGILLGVEAGIPPEVQAAFRDTGTSHIIAISGFNIAILVALLAGMLGRLLGPGRTGARRGALAAVGGIILYAILVGGQASVVRAAIMGGLALFAIQLGRRTSGLNGLMFVAAVMALFTPFILWDVGFQLSFTATLGLVLFAGSLSAWFERLASRRLSRPAAKRLSQPVGEYFLYTLAATLLTLPVIVYHFQRLSLVSLVANPLVLPVQPALMVLGGLATILGMLWAPLGQWLAYLAWPLAAYTIRMVETLANLPLAAVSLGKIGLPLVAAFYILLLAVVLGGPHWKTWLASRRSGGLKMPDWLPAGAKPQSVLCFGGLAALTTLTVIIWQAVATAPDGRLHLTVFDVGSGEALLIRTPSGRSLLINGGPSPGSLSEGLGRRLPITSRKLEYLVVAGTGNAQLAALPGNLERFPPAQVLWAGDSGSSRGARELVQALNAASIPILQAKTGHILDLGDGASLQVLTTNPQGAALLLEWNNFRALLPVGLDEDSLAELQNDPSLRDVSILLLADGGSVALNPPAWLHRLNPQLVLLSVGAGDLRGRPDAEVTDALENYNFMRTDQNGWIELATDGEQMWVEVERK